jgi:hypothetical protein
MRDVTKVCTFQGGDYKVIYRCEDDPRKQQIVHITQVAHIGKPEWHLDLWNMEVDSWEDADNLIHQISCFINVIKAGEV